MTQSRKRPYFRVVLVAATAILLSSVLDESAAQAVGPTFTLPASGNTDHLGDAADHGDAALLSLNGSMVGMAATPDNGGYWLLGSDGGVFSYGSAKFFGSTGNIKLNQPVVGMSSSTTGNGYRFVASDGGIFAYGDAKFAGSAGGIKLNKPVVGMAATPTGNGYWLVASDGGIFAYGDTRFYGSTGGSHINQPIVGMTSTPSGNGYWLVASDGGIFAYGDAQFYGSTGAIKLNQPIVGMAASKTGKGYWMAAADGGVFAYGDAKFYGTGGAHGKIVGLTRTSSGSGYWFVSSIGAVVSDNYPVIHYPAPGEAVDGTDTYQFEYLSGGGPARWDPCTAPVHVRLSSYELPVGGEQLLLNALRELSAITGLKFQYDGTFNGAVSLTEVQNNAISVGWLKSGEYTGGSGTDGYTQVQWYYANRGARMFSADVELLVDTDQSWYQPTGGVDGNYENVLKHEVGHALGLWHDSASSQVMYPTSNMSITDYQAGDLQGLADIGASAGCVK